MHSNELRQLLETLGRSAERAGLDLCSAFPVDAYNRSVARAYLLPDLGRQGPVGVLLGNSRAFWPAFLEALRASEKLRESDHPVNTYVAETVRGLVQGLPLASEARWAHSSEPGPVAIQRAARIAGLAHTSPSHLSIHPVHGPWIALRAVLVLDEDWPWAGPAPAPDPCTPCRKPCLPALDRAVAASKDAPMAKKVSESWRLWLAVRDACPVGRSSRYPDEQCEYHYRPSRSLLLSLLGSEEPR